MITVTFWNVGNVSSDDALDDMVDNFLNEFNKFDLYELLSEASKNADLRQDLNERYLFDYLNMVYSAQSDLEFQVKTLLRPALSKMGTLALDDWLADAFKLQDLGDFLKKLISCNVHSCVINSLSRPRMSLQTSTLSQIAHRIFETHLPANWRDKHVAECAILVQIYHLRLGGDIQLEALQKALTVYTQVKPF